MSGASLVVVWDGSRIVSIVEIVEHHIGCMLPYFSPGPPYFDPFDDDVVPPIHNSR